jgi:Fe-S-cluster-containing hydrogenase component 2
MTACPVEAIGISAVGAKEVREDRCVGCKLCVLACPYGTVFYDAEREKAVKCDLCAGDPACAKACPTHAITFGPGEARDWLGAFAAERAFGADAQG